MSLIWSRQQHRQNDVAQSLDRPPQRLAMTDIQWPKDSHRLYIGGKTGTGKTQAGAWHLSGRSFGTRPWIIFDFKQDELLQEIPAQDIDLGKPPRKPGLYRLSPLPNQQEEVEEYLWKIWQKENTGIYIDEAYMIGDTPAFRAILTQGRSKKIPVIVLSQRPSWISRFVFSESDYFQQFWLNDIRDRKSVKSFVPYDVDRIRDLPDYWSIWYDVGKDRVIVLKPVPDRDTILGTFTDRLGLRKRFV